MLRPRCSHCGGLLNCPPRSVQLLDSYGAQHTLLYHPACDSPSGRLRQRAIRQFLKRNRDRLGLRIEGNLIISNTGGEGHAAI